MATKKKKKSKKKRKFSPAQLKAQAVFKAAILSGKWKKKGKKKKKK